MQDKVERLAALLKLSRRTVVYSGAGISTAAGVSQAARGGAGRVGGRATTEAAPTTAHMAVARLHQLGLVHSWVNQNHDGLAQKSGYPQEDLVEVLKFISSFLD